MIYIEGALCALPQEHPAFQARIDLFESPLFIAHAEARTFCGQCPAIHACRKALEGQLNSPDWRTTEGTWAGRLFQEGKGDVTTAFLLATARQETARANPSALAGFPSSPHPCDACFAQPGEPCWTKAGNPAGWLHVGREAA